MAQNVISTAILIIAAVIAVAALINAMLPTVYGLSGSVSSVAGATNDRMRTSAGIICESLNGSDRMLDVYLKNTGTLKISAHDLGLTDVYFGNGSTLSKCPKTGTPSWSYALPGGNGDASWDPGETLLITIAAGGYSFRGDAQHVKIVLANGAGIEAKFAL